MAMTSCHNIDEQMSQKRDDQMSDEQLSHNPIITLQLEGTKMHESQNFMVVVSRNWLFYPAM